MQERQKLWPTKYVIVFGIGACVALAVGGTYWSHLLHLPGLSTLVPWPVTADPAPVFYPFLELLKLMVAAVLGLAVTAVHRHFHRGKPLSRSLEHAEVLLCISGAMMMIIIGNSLARAFGIAGAA